MEIAIETMVFLGLGIIIMGLVLVFLKGWDLGGDVDTLNDMYGQDGKDVSTRLSKSDFTKAARDFWDECNHSYINETRIVYVYNTKKAPDGNLTKEYMFDVYRSLSWCHGIQSANLSCGTREDINMTTFDLPAVVRMNCTNETLYIRKSGT